MSNKRLERLNNTLVEKLNSSASLARKSSIAFAEPEQLSHDVNPDRLRDCCYLSITIESNTSKPDNEESDDAQKLQEEKKDTEITIKFDKDIIGKEEVAYNGISNDKD